MLLVGVPGCGKSLACKTLASLWKLPLIRLDIGALMGSLVGQSEANLRQALKVAESASPCILWLDEIEKGLSGINCSGFSDGGTTARVFGTLLTWLQEKTAPVYVVATSNDISALPPELMRAGRFDQVFWVDLPNAVERSEIWQIHLAKTKRDPGAFSIDVLVETSDGYTGAEIATAVGDALHQGFDEGREIVTDDLVQAICARIPLTVTMREQIDDLREWAARRARPASSRIEADKGEQTSRAAKLDL
jgi:SpoVK/Ycf46/Vps4 family AAA+-type ATPase